MDTKMDGLKDKATGRVKSAVGAATGDHDMESEGHADRTKGEVKKKVGDAQHAIADALDGDDK
jgi:uncharacterized protein YjbJ (UPF0337 family)